MSTSPASAFAAAVAVDVASVGAHASLLPSSGSLRTAEEFPVVENIGPLPRPRRRQRVAGVFATLALSASPASAFAAAGAVDVASVGAHASLLPSRGALRAAKEFPVVQNIGPLPSPRRR